MASSWIAFVGSVVLSSALTWFVKHRAHAQGRFDVPNERSSHSVPTARGGGLSIALVALVAALWAGASHSKIAAALAIGGAAIASIGYLDDRVGLSASLRFAVHMAAGAVFVWLVVPTAAFEGIPVKLPVAAWLCMIIFWMVWSINSFNFMDGIDGLAASQALFVFLASGILIVWTGNEPASVTSHVLWASAGAVLGFLMWNWPPAKIFMGDVGSGFLGFWIAALGIILHVEGLLSIWTSVVLSSLFVADATATLVRRVARGKRWYEAHRSHAYQRLARRWNSHLRVTALLWVLNVFVIGPLAVASELWTQSAPFIAVFAFLAFSAGALLIGAGCDDP